MPFSKKIPETVARSVRLERPSSEPPDEYSRFVACTTSYVSNLALRNSFARDPECTRWKAARTGSGSRNGTTTSAATPSKT
jgi:hypothetical protein